jgi:tRNA A37 methylthiotransferase MiaB
MAYCFKYSPRFKNKDPLTVTETELERRHSILLKEVKKIAKEKMKEKIGSIEQVLLYDSRKGKTNTGYNCCIIDNNEEKKDFLKIKITEIKNNTLYGRAYD